MKLYDSGRAPNPRRVKIFLAEKGITIPTEQIDLTRLEHKGEAYSALNPVQQVPALVLDDDFVLTETIAICRYFEELQPEPPLFGTDAFSRALVEMWQRRIEFGLLVPVAAVFRHLHPAMAQMEVPQVPAWGEANKERVNRFLAVLDKELVGQRFICGPSFTVADITGLVGLDFMKPAKLAVPDEFTHVRRWHEALSARPSAKA
ncbi:glutathione S-transferase family protein [Enterovirga aerilata]|uniref:Glutathione S-transferase n=1 Tax=Enterovirga aerilata TaxID=2730920 RepID=A0A849I311_9HYPH|nr:glutathione S-transferase [Enterovirga sp. DB1703]NNM72024.1 glutathione S-transferase [Enterovirga sp. DB1703]